MPISEFFERLEKRSEESRLAVLRLAEESRLAVLRLAEESHLAVLSLAEQSRIADMRRLVEIRLAEEHFDAKFDHAVAQLGLRRVSSSSSLRSAAPVAGKSSERAAVVHASQKLANSSRTMSANGSPGTPVADAAASGMTLADDANPDEGIRRLSDIKASSAGADVLAGDAASSEPCEGSTTAVLPVPTPVTRPDVGFVKR